jgi:hypothetical protein
MLKTLYLHIGHYKTGTTALQVFLANNRKPLLARGVDYCSTLNEHAKHSSLAFSLYRRAGVKTLMHGYNKSASPEDIWNDLFDYARKSPCSNVVVSSEELIRLGEFDHAADTLRQIIEPMRAEFDIRIIAYLRAPGTHLHSWYNQLVKMGKASVDFNTAVQSGVVESIHYDYEKALSPWIDILGPEAVFLRPYLSSYKDDWGLYRDFLSLMDVSFEKGRKWWLPDGDVNPRIDDRLLELHRIMPLAGLPHDYQKWVGLRAEKLLDVLSVQNGAIDRRSWPDFDEIAQRSLSGISAVTKLPNSALGLAELEAILPVASDPIRAELALMVGVLLRELNVLRENTLPRQAEMGVEQASMKARLDRLEAQLANQTSRG